MFEMSSKPPLIADEDPTLEEEAPQFDPTRTDNLAASDVSIVAAGGDSVGAIEHDDRGEARWKWITETNGALESDKTFNHLKALSNTSLALQQTPASTEPEKPSRKTGYNPYDVAGPAALPTMSKPAKPTKARK